jgi:SprT-like family.
MTSFVEEAYLLFEDAYRFFNHRLFDDALPVCLITFQRQARLMGYVAFKRWVNNDGKVVDELAINPAYFANYPLISILQTLCHEMVHVWQEHFGKPSRGGYHNLEWATKMQSVGLMPSSTGESGGATVGQVMSDYVIEGGPFERACRELLDSGFKLKWYDTVQMPPPVKSIAARRPQSNVVSLFRESNTPPPPTNPLYENFPADLDAIARNFEEQCLEERIPLPRPTVQTSKAQNKSNRHKYYCPSCFIQLWGKPSLRVICACCNQELIEDT